MCLHRAIIMHAFRASTLLDTHTPVSLLLESFTARLVQILVHFSSSSSYYYQDRITALNAQTGRLDLFPDRASPRLESLVAKLYFYFERLRLVSRPPNCAEMRTIQSSPKPLNSSFKSLWNGDYYCPLRWWGRGVCVCVCVCFKIQKDTVIAIRSSFENWPLSSCFQRKKKNGWRGRI